MAFGRLTSDRRRRALLLGTLAAVVALLVGYGAGLLTPSLRAPGDNSPEAGFARDMSTHHAQAVEMGMVAYQKATNDDVRQLGYNIALTQQAQIGMMSVWLKDWRLQPTGDRPKMAWMPNGSKELTADGLMPGMATDGQMAQLHSATGKDMDILFCQLMLRHHLGGIHMIDGVLRQSHNATVRQLAQTMKLNQQGDIDVLQNLLKQLGAKPLGS
jgi:uncharacterized protein (DUF305 family)